MKISEIPVLILAGGRGSRIKHLLNNFPKPMYPVLGKPFLDYQIKYLKKFGFSQFFISTGYQASVIHDYYSKDINVTCIYENEPLGTGGGVLLAAQTINANNFIVLNGDTLYLLDFDSFVTQSLINKNNSTIALKQVDDVSRYGEVTLGENNIIKSFIEKNKSGAKKGLINAGIYFLNKKQIIDSCMPSICSMETDIFPSLQRSGLYGYVSSDSFIDIGTPETLGEIENFIVINNLT